MPRIIPIRDLKDTAAISQMCSESTEPVYITKKKAMLLVLEMKVVLLQIWRMKNKHWM